VGDDTICHILATKGILVLNYIDNIVGIAPSDVTDNQFSVTIGLFEQLGSFINHSKTLPPTSVASCLGIFFTFDWVFFKSCGPNCRRLFLSATTILAKLLFQNKNCRPLLALTYFYIKPLNLVGYLLTASWLFSGT
jgi:hypothetical protein